MQEKIYSPETEQALLAYTLRHPDRYVQLVDIVKPSDFGWVAFGWVWTAFETIIEKGMQVDEITVGDELERTAKLTEFCLPGSKQFTGRAALSSLREQETTEAGESYAITVQDYAAKRAIDRWVTQAHTWAHNGRPAANIIQDLEASFGTLMLHQGKAHAHTIGMDVATARALEASEAAGRGERAVSTGLIDLDKVLSPQKTDFIVIGGRTGQGKSALCGTIAINAALAGKRVKLFTAEMGSTQVTQRLLANLSGVDSFRIIKGTLSPDEKGKLQLAAERLQELAITICDLSEIKIGQIRTECRREPIDVAILDYLQLANSDTKQDRRDLDIGEVTRGCKGLAKELEIVFFAAAQLGRGADGRENKEPRLSDLRESGSIEQDADSVVFIHRTEDDCKLIIGKHRNGPTGTISVYFRESTISFCNSSYSDNHPEDDTI